MRRRPHPLQTVVLDKEGTARFRANAIVVFLLELARKHGVDMNELAAMGFDLDDQEHFAQLIGYSVSGFGDLSYVSDRQYEAAAERVEALLARCSRKAARS